MTVEQLVLLARPDAFIVGETTPLLGDAPMYLDPLARLLGGRCRGPSSPQPGHRA